MAERTRDAECVELLQWALPRLRLRWKGFRKVRRQVCRRLRRRVEELGLAGLADYRRLLDADPGEWIALDRLCRVTISRFCRDRAVFAALGQRGWGELAEIAGQGGHRRLRCWSAGCASGEEPYSLALSWRFQGAPAAPGLGFEVVASDTDPHLLARARRATYPESSLREVPDSWRFAAFEDRHGLCCLRPELRARVRFVQEDLRTRFPEGPFHLVLWRNLVFTYFEPELQRELLARLPGVLPPGGFLMVGAHEELPEGSPGFARWRWSPRIHIREGTGARLTERGESRRRAGGRAIGGLR